jgi:hypothetical protein
VTNAEVVNRANGSQSLAHPWRKVTDPKQLCAPYEF